MVLRPDNLVQTYEKTIKLFFMFNACHAGELQLSSDPNPSYLLYIRPLYFPVIQRLWYSIIKNPYEPIMMECYVRVLNLIAESACFYTFIRQKKQDDLLVS